MKSQKVDESVLNKMKKEGGGRDRFIESETESSE